jgi:transcriptional regulator with XRE-family HTH domain
MNNFGKNLRYLREKNDHTQDDIEIFIGIKKTTWSHYENGKSEPSMERLIQISNFFGVTLNELIVDDLAKRENAEDNMQTKNKPYASDRSYMKMEDGNTGYGYIIKELKRLRKEMDAMKQSQKKQSGQQ